MNINFFLRNLWLWKCGLVEMNIMNKNINYWSWKFEKFMKNRMNVGAYRYGELKGKDKKQYKRVQDIKRRLSLYEKEGNKEYLVDIANMCMLEFEEGEGFFVSQKESIHTDMKKE